MKNYVLETKKFFFGITSESESESNMVKARKLITNSSISIGCFAHLLHNCLKDSLIYFKKNIDSVKHIAQLFKQSSLNLNN